MARSHPISRTKVRDLTDDTVQQIITDALRQDFGQLSTPTKRIASAAGSGMRAADKWFNGHAAPSAGNLLRLLAVSPTLAAEVRRITAMEADHDPDTERAISAAVQAYLQARGG